MKAVAVFPSQREVRLWEQPEPQLGRPDEVLLRVLEVGVCGTDKEIASFEYGTPPSGEDHLVIGHEALAEVLEAGPEVQGLARGDLVIPMVRRPCPHSACPACRAGRPDFCVTGDFTERGIKARHGFMTELVVDRAQYLNVVPRELRDVGVLVEPLTIAEKALLQLGRIQDRLPWSRAAEGQRRGLRAVVLGAGPVGLLGAMTLVSHGYDTFVYSRSPAPNAKSKLCEAIGVRYISSEETPVERMAEKVGSIDVVYEGVGASKISFEVLEALGTNGVFIFTGVPGRKAPIELAADRLMRNIVLKNQVVLGTVNAGRDAFEAAIRDLGRFLRRWPEAVHGLVTGRYPMEEHAELLSGRAGGIKNVVRVAEGT
jgi:glucose 1-dehydrogenase